MTLRPRDLPKARARTISRMSEVTSGPNPYMLPSDYDLTALMFRHLRAAELYWATEDMAALAVHAGAQLDEARWATADRPSACGLMVFDGGLGMVEIHPGMDGPVAALAWGPGPGQTLVVWHLMTSEQFLGGVTVPNMDEVPPLIGIREVRLPVTVEPVPLDGLPAREGMAPSRTIVAALGAAWKLLQQPHLIERTELEAHRSDMRSLRRAGMPAGGVSLLALRRQYVPDGREPGESDRPKDGYRRVVSGTWRHYRDKRFSEVLRTEGPWWIPSYVKGPEGAPLLLTEKVNVWRR